MRTIFTFFLGVAFCAAVALYSDGKMLGTPFLAIIFGIFVFLYINVTDFVRAPRPKPRQRIKR